MSKLIRKLRKTQSEVALEDHDPSPAAIAFKSHKPHSFQLKRTFTAFEEEDLASLQTNDSNDPILLIKRGELAELMMQIDGLQLSLKFQDEKGFTLLHYAAEFNQIPIIQYLLNSAVDINQVDAEGNAPLHVAIKNGFIEAMKCLLERKDIDSSVLNNEMESPFHTAVRYGSPELVREYMSHDTVDYFVKGRRGRIAFHLAAELDRHEIVEVILEFAKRAQCTCKQSGAFRLCAKDDDELTPLHLAARSGSARCLDVMIAHAQSVGYPVEKILSFLDDENSTPLHSAVDAGYTEVVEVLMKYGASPTVMKEGQPSPLHLAAFLGSISVLKALGKHCTLEQLEIQNSEGRVALQIAAFSSRNVECVQYFIDQGCDVNHQDTFNKTTPLLAAVCSGALASVKVLLKHGANPLLQLDDGCNALQLAIKKGRRSIINELLSHPSAKELIAACNNEGLNALHYAITNNLLDLAQDIVHKKQVCCYTKTKDNNNILHLAASGGNPRMLSLFLSLPESFNLVNEGNSYGGTPLHFAAGHGHLKCVELLLDKGAMIHRCHAGFSPFMFACSKGFSDVAKVLLDAHPFQLNWTNDDGDSALHVASKCGNAAVVKMLLDSGESVIHNEDYESFLDIAIKNVNKEIALVAVQHERWEECLQLVSPNLPSPMLSLVERLPDVARVVLDCCLTTSSLHAEHCDYWVRYDFQFLVERFSNMRMGNRVESIESKLYDNVSMKGPRREIVSDQKRNPLAILRSMLHYRRLVCLTHPVLVQFLKYKWQLYGKKFLFFRLLLALLLVVLLSAYIGSSTPPRHFPTDINADDAYNFTALEGKTASKGLRIAILLLCSLEAVSWTISIYCFVKLRAAIAQILPVILFGTSSIVTMYIFLLPSDPVWEAGVISIITTWLYFICMVQFYEGIGIYVIMLLEVTYSLLRVIIFAVLIFVAFGLALFVLIGEISQYSTPGRAMFTVLASMVEGIATEGILERDAMGMLSYRGLTYITIIVMTFLLPVIMINLFIGLAVGDIEKVRENATVTQRQLQIALYSFVDPVLSLFCAQSVNKEYIIMTPNRHKYLNTRWLRWIWLLWRSSVSAVNIVENSNEDDDRYIEQEVRIAKMQASMAEMENQLHMLMEQQQKQMEATNSILSLLRERADFTKEL
ncbi:transient receptor potential cation channel subfamily A member 1-like [Dysidea avara]|uniref:transient receptor potential cation channel subfamily A member 1-like n=1 Tax=Dysidea avara TaxID=196820 RepID=UPI00332EB0D9